MNMIANRVLLLSLISLSSSKGWLGITKLHKLAFLIEYLLSKEGTRAFDYEFFMYNYGPISKEIYDDFGFFMNEQLIIESEEGIRLTEHGENVKKQFKGLIPENIYSAMFDVVNKYISMKTDDLVEMVHKMDVKLPDGDIARIEDLATNSLVLPRPKKAAFKIGEEYLETFQILCDRPLLKIIQQTRKEKHKSKKYEPLSPSLS